ncbi:MAG: hypothetical protein OEY89_05415 [Gammaproteobacteria bacterium]|nr:hypothetical protein [Gammaproteobacteria bacterium]
MNKIKYLIVLLLPVIITACSFGKNTVNLDEVKKIKTVAVIIYTVPEKIIYKADARDSSGSLTAALVDSATGNTGSNAADIAVHKFTETLQKEGMTFKVIPHSTVLSNAKYKSLYKPVVAAKKDADEGLLAKSLSFLGSMAGNSSAGAAPKGMNQYGLIEDWRGDTALTGKSGESEYIQKSIEALKVDAVLVINDMGFSFSCEACIGSTGVASTGSAFNATMITRSGPVMNIREWFATTDEQGAMVTGIVDPTEHKELYEEHGRKMAQVYAAAVKESLAAK